MNKGKYVFAQIVEFLPQRIFDGIVEKYSGNKKVHSFTCWNQMLCMIFGQLTARDSLRDLIVSLEAHRNKFYHLGFGTSVSRRNIGHANESRDYRIFEDFAMYMIETARKTCYRSDFETLVGECFFKRLLLCWLISTEYDLFFKVTISESQTQLLKKVVQNLLKIWL